MADRRRVNGPGGSSLPPVYDDGELDAVSRRQRAPDAIRPLCESPSYDEITVTRD